jgi:nucleoid-associated protein YgaU
MKAIDIKRLPTHSIGMPETPLRARAALVRAAVLLAGSLAATALTWRLRPTGTATTPVDAIVLACAWAAWLLAGWLALCVAVCAAGQLRGRRGTDRQRVAIERCVPRRLGRLVDAVVTAGLVGAVVGGAAVPASATDSTTLVVAASHRTASGDPLDWPGLADRPSTPRAHDPAPAQPRSGAPKIGLVSAAPRGAADREPVVTVRAGDSLWSIAAAHLGSEATAAQIAAQWPRWYAANRSVIGADPTLILPGQQLRPPAEQATDRTAHHRAGSSR